MPWPSPLKRISTKWPKEYLDVSGERCWMSYVFRRAVSEPCLCIPWTWDEHSDEKRSTFAVDSGYVFPIRIAVIGVPFERNERCVAIRSLHLPLGQSSD